MALLLVGILPLISAVVLANEVVRRVSQTAFQPEFGDQLDRSLELYAELVKALKSSMRSEGALMATDAPTRDAVSQEDPEAATKALRRLLREHPTVQTVVVEDEDGNAWLQIDRDRPLDEAKQRTFSVRSPIEEERYRLVSTFAVDRTRLDEMDRAQQFVQGWKAFASRSRSEWIVRPYLSAFAALFGVTVLFAVAMGVLLVRPVIRRLRQLAEATRPVAEGDLSVRVPAEGRDEIADLARAFNDMLEQLGRSRVRIEFLRRMGEWQNMARRLAHEIKNPLTPIQLAVEECHSRYDGDDAKFQRLLGTTHDIVVEEVASLRRLVGEFAEFARLPRADLREGDLRDFFAEQRPRLTRELPDRTELLWEVGDAPLPVAHDKTMLYRVILNLLQNAHQAAPGAGEIAVSAERLGDTVVVTIDDAGPGLEPDLAPVVFDPYVTSKQDGTGLGLTIVKKIIIDHGGTIEAAESPLGGARFRIELPVAGTSASEAALATG